MKKSLLRIPSVFFTYFLTISLAYKFESSFQRMSNLINITSSEYFKVCDEGDTETCYNRAYEIIYSYDFAEIERVEKDSRVDLNSTTVEYNKILSKSYFYAGEIEYFGLISKTPDLIEGFRKLMISAYYGNPGALYKMYIFMETGILGEIKEIAGYERMMELPNSLQEYIAKSSFYQNFQIDDEYAKKSIGFNFLYSSAMSKFPSAISTLAYKYLKGYGVVTSCETSLKYYKESSSINVHEIYKRAKPNYYEKVSLATLEYVGHKFSAENQMDINDIIDYFKVEAANGNVQYIQQLGQRFLYGQGIQQDFYQSFYYFDMGSQLNDSLSTFYLGELYLNGWGVEKNYTQAKELYEKAMGMNNGKAYNSLGYMYYYGLGVEKSIKKAYDYFRNALKKGEDSDSYFNIITLLIEGNNEIQVDVAQAYKYANVITGKGHTFGTHMFAMLNEYQLGSILKTCEITLEFFKAVSERNILAKRKFDNAIINYKDGNYQVASLMYLELAEEGHEFGQVNAGILFKNYNIFINKQLNSYLSYKYFTMAHKVNNIYATLQVADLNFFGFRDLEINYHKAYKLYKRVIEKSHDNNNFYIAHAYFHLAKMNHYGLGMEKNTTKALKFYNQTTSFEETALYPGLIMKYVIMFENSDFGQVIENVKISLQGFFTWTNPIFAVLIALFGLYLVFVFMLFMQK